MLPIKPTGVQGDWLNLIATKQALGLLRDRYQDKLVNASRQSRNPIVSDFQLRLLLNEALAIEDCLLILTTVDKSK